MKFNRIFLIVCDSMGIGNAKDAKKYNGISGKILVPAWLIRSRYAIKEKGDIK